MMAMTKPMIWMLRLLPPAEAAAAQACVVGSLFSADHV
jgi:hypothetical protein